MTTATGRFLLDTNIVIALLEGEAGVRSCLQSAAEVYISAVVVGELVFGALKSGRPAENLGRVESFVKGRSILPCDLAVAREYGRMKNLLREKGRPIPENDIWLAATAVFHRLTLVTRDRHFDEVDGLQRVGWS